MSSISGTTPPKGGVPAKSGAGGRNQYRRGAGITPNYGRRRVKYYPITEGELIELQGIGILATTCFSLGSAMIGFAVSVHKDLALATPDVPTSPLHWWDGMHYGILAGGVLLMCVGIGAFVFGKTRVKTIKDETEFDNDA